MAIVCFEGLLGYPVNRSIASVPSASTSVRKYHCVSRELFTFYRTELVKVTKRVAFFPAVGNEHLHAKVQLAVGYAGRVLFDTERRTVRAGARVVPMGNDSLYLEFESE